MESIFDKNGKGNTMKNSIVRYANDLDTRDISRMNAQAQNVFSVLLAEWTKTKQTRIEIPLSTVKKKINDPDRSEKYIARQVENITRSIVARSVVTGRQGKGFFCIALIPYVEINSDRTMLIAECRPEFLQIFEDLNNGYTEYTNQIFVRIRGKYAKNLFRIFRRYWKGRVEMRVDELKEALGLPPETRGGDLMNAVRRAIADLKKNGAYEDISVMIHRAESRGAPISSVEFHYKMAKEKAAELAGQEKIPGLDGAAGPFPQAPAAAPDGTAPFPADDPPFSASDVSPAPGHTDPHTGLYIPSQEELDARHMSAPEQSWRPAYSKPDTPEDPPKCPKCGGDMIKRTAKSDGHEFWGCARFPKCRGTRDLDGTDTSKKP